MHVGKKGLKFGLPAAAVTACRSYLQEPRVCAPVQDGADLVGPGKSMKLLMLRIIRIPQACDGGTVLRWWCDVDGRRTTS